GGVVLMAVHAVTAGAVEVDEAHRVLGQTQEAREGFAVAMGALRRSPNCRGILRHLGDRAGRADRGMALHRPEKRGASCHRSRWNPTRSLPAGREHLVAGIAPAPHTP